MSAGSEPPRRLLEMSTLTRAVGSEGRPPSSSLLEMLRYLLGCDKVVVGVGVVGVALVGS